MHSFSVVSLITLGLAAFSSAAPYVSPSLQARDTTTTTTNSVTSVTTIVTTANDKVAPLTAELYYIVAGNATAEVLSPILEEIKGILVEAIDAVEAITQDPLNTVIDTVSISKLAQIVAALLCTIFGALAAVLKSVAAAEYDIVFPLLYDVGCLVGELLELILKLVHGLLEYLLPLVGAIVEIVLELNLRSIINLLGFHP